MNSKDNLIYGFKRDIHEQAGNIIDKEIYKCVSHAIETMISNSNSCEASREIGFSFDHIENLYMTDH